MRAALSHALAQRDISCVVVGVDSVVQLQQIIAAAQFDGEAAPAQLQSTDETLIDPSRWSAL
jgi:aryl-alcohol dehydrogenase-like predicted oxidoreductase